MRSRHWFYGLGISLDLFLPDYVDSSLIPPKSNDVVIIGIFADDNIFAGGSVVLGHKIAEERGKVHIHGLLAGRNFMKIQVGVVEIHQRFDAEIGCVFRSEDIDVIILGQLVASFQTIFIYIFVINQVNILFVAHGKVLSITETKVLCHILYYVTICFNIQGAEKFGCFKY